MPSEGGFIPHFIRRQVRARGKAPAFKPRFLRGPLSATRIPTPSLLRCVAHRWSHGSNRWSHDSTRLGQLASPEQAAVARLSRRRFFGRRSLCHLAGREDWHRCVNAEPARMGTACRQPKECSSTVHGASRSMAGKPSRFERTERVEDLERILIDSASRCPRCRSVAIARR